MRMSKKDLLLSCALNQTHIHQRQEPTLTCNNRKGNIDYLNKCQIALYWKVTDKND